ncbi:MAG: hypothetical protein PHN57_04785 [Candidatus Omnitrophica bacterium]|nr:hypothetical protein [Candidatus Omnitrophota bacterium]
MSFFTGYALAEQKTPAPGATGLNSDIYALAQDVVGKLFDSYRYYARDSFEKVVSSDMAGRPEFISQVEKDYFSATDMEMNFFAEDALSKDNTLAVKVKWEKKAQPYNANTPVMSKGACELTFKKTGGSWLLYQVSGDNPF